MDFLSVESCYASQAVEALDLAGAVSPPKKPKLSGSSDIAGTVDQIVAELRSAFRGQEFSTENLSLAARTFRLLIERSGVEKTQPALENFLGSKINQLKMVTSLGKAGEKADRLASLEAAFSCLGDVFKEEPLAQLLAEYQDTSRQWCLDITLRAFGRRESNETQLLKEMQSCLAKGASIENSCVEPSELVPILIDCLAYFGKDQMVIEQAVWEQLLQKEGALTKVEPKQFRDLLSKLREETGHIALSRYDRKSGSFH